VRAVATVIFVRHGRTTANASGVLAGWTEGIGLDEAGQAQVRATAERLTGVRLAAVVSSPLQRCVETATALLERRDVLLETDDRLGECGYGEWTGKELKVLARDQLWRVVQGHPSAVRFPGGESLREVQVRAVDVVRATNARLEAEHGPDAVWAAVSHGDVIKAVLADALGMHLDAFQRIVVDPASVSVVRYTELRPFVLRTNDAGADLSWLQPPARKGRRTRKRATSGTSSDAVIGGGAGHAAPAPAATG
jgi:probable phosphomutase (TIGR03848 family)